MAASASTSLFAATSVASLPSVNAFRSAGSPVQHVPMTSFRSKSKCGSLVIARASSEEPRFPIRREILAGILAAGALLSSTGPVFADPLSDAKSKVEEALSGAQGSAGKTADDVKSKIDNSSVSSVPDSAGKAASEAKGRIDGIFGGNKAPFNFDAGSAGSDAKEAVASKVDEAKKTISQ